MSILSILSILTLGNVENVLSSMWPCAAVEIFP